MSTSTEQNPIFTFPEPGVYAVSLTVTLPNMQTATVTKKITILSGVNYSFEDLEYSFTFDPGDLCVTSYLWHFGDGETSTDQNPVHTYADDGSYTVSLDVVYCDTTEETITLPPFDASAGDGTWCYEWDAVSDFLADGFDFFQNDPESKFYQYIGGFTFNRILFGWTSTQLGGDSALAIWKTPGETDAIVFATPLSSAPNPAEYDDIPLTVDGVSFGINADDGDGIVTLTSPALHIEGTGPRPPWTHGHSC